MFLLMETTEGSTSGLGDYNLDALPTAPHRQSMYYITLLHTSRDYAIISLLLLLLLLLLLC